MLLTRLGGVAVFVYHGIAENAPAGLSHREVKYWVTGEDLCSHLDCIGRDCYQVWSLGDLWSSGDSRDEARSVVVTFDDGLWSQYERAYPLLAQRHIRAHFFVNTAFVGRPGYLGWPEIREMHRAGMSFQSHAHDHVYLSRLTPRVARVQLETSKAILEDHLGCAVDFIAPPYGDYDRAVLSLAAESGYRAVCTGRSLPAKIARGYIDRTVVYRNMDERRFRALMQRSPLAYGDRLARAVLKQVPKRIWIHLRRQDTTVS